MSTNRSPQERRLRRVARISKGLVHFPTLLAAWVALQIVIGGWHAFPSRLVSAAEQDFRAELPRIAPLSPLEAMASFTLLDGLRIEQVAAEPLVVDPVAMAFDEMGRLYVVEMRGYSEDGDKGLGRIRRLEDTDGDGAFDASVTFAEGFSWPTAIACYDGGVFVGAAPDIWYCKDSDGDGRVDVRRRVFTGFGRGNVQGLLNTFKWGLDGRIHGATSVSAANVRRAYTPSGPGAPSVSLRGRDFAFDPRTLELMPTSGGAQHGLSFDDWGRKFVCSNSDHLQFVMFEDRYAARNPYLPSPRSRISIASDGGQAIVYRKSPVEPWRIVRTRLRVTGKARGPIEGGGKPAGYFTGSTGVTIYRGDALPDAFGGMAFIGDVGSNIVHRKRVEPDGLAFRGTRVDQQSEFLASSDIWFRPVQFNNGPDGALYVADMYREVIEHPKSLPPAIKKHLDLASGRDRGRIYRIVSAKFRQPAPSELKVGQLGVAGLVRTLEHANGWHRTTAMRLLFERRPEDAIEPLQRLATHSPNALARTSARYVLWRLDQLTDDILLQALADPVAESREHALRLAERRLDSAAIRDAVFRLTEDPSPRVRYQLAFSLGEIESPSVRKLDTLLSLLKRDGQSQWMRFAVGTAVPDDAAGLLKRVEAEPTLASSDSGKAIVGMLRKMIAAPKTSNGKAARRASPRIVAANQRAPSAIKARANLARKYMTSLDRSGDSLRGAALFKQHCATCHRVGGVGKVVGPSLEAMRNRGPAAIVKNVIDPNAEVNPQFVSYNIATTDGQTHMGLIQSESATSLSLLRGDGSSVTLLKVQIASIRNTGLSLMPEGFEAAFDVQAMADLTAFLMQQR